MANIFDWSSTAGNNLTVDGISIANGMTPANVDNAMRSIMALVRNTFVSGWQGVLAGTEAGIPSSNGAGTITAKTSPDGDIVGTTDTQTLTNKTITGGTITGITDLAIADGGTAASTAVQALANFGFGQGTNANGTYLRIPLTDGNYCYLQWGTATSGYNGWSSSYTLPVTCFFGFLIFATPTATRAGAADGNSISAKSVSTSQYQIGNDDSDYCPVNWFAVGVSNS